jgi:predicted ribosome quality control (RQC) complex YloA/Tae2 family protein
LKKKLKKETRFFLNNKLNTFKLEKAKLESTINLLKNELSLKNEIMKQQKKDINLLKRKVLLLEKKVNYIYGYYPH